MKLRIMSDVHTDSSKYRIPDHPENKEQTLILAGDIADGIYGVGFIQDCCNKFLRVIMVPGNHEYYDENLDHFDKYLMEFVKRDNFYLINCDTLDLGDVVFIGATLWTSINSQDYFAVKAAKKMSDFHVIYKGGVGKERLFKPIDFVELHEKHLAYIKERVYDLKYSGKKIVVITHHAPSYQSSTKYYKLYESTHCFCNELRSYIIDQPIALWVHGHTHNHVDYQVGDCRVVCNPRGCHGEIGTGFVENFLIEV